MSVLFWPSASAHVLRGRANMATVRRGVRENLKEFINIYRNEPCIWQMKHKDYHNRDKKKAAYDKLIEQFKKIEPSANRDVVVKKINGLRTNYRKELKKVEESTRTAASIDDVYKPTLWYYDLMTFLNDDQETSMSSPSTNDGYDSTEERAPDMIESHFILSQQSDHNTPGTASASAQPSCPRPPKRKINNCTPDSTDPTTEVSQCANQHSKCCSTKDDRYDIFGKNVAMKLRDLPPQQRLIAEKIINDTLFDAEMGNLTLIKRELHEQFTTH